MDGEGGRTSGWKGRWLGGWVKGWWAERWSEQSIDGREKWRDVTKDECIGKWMEG